MALVSMRQLLDHAAENGYGIPAFNVNNLEQVQAIMEAAAEVNAPVIMQASAGARKYAGEPFLKHLIQAAVESYPNIPIVMHQDHGQSPDVCKGAIGLGFTSVMMDGSLEADGKTIASYDYNVDVTKKVVEMAHSTGVTVEGELGCLGSLETMRGDKEDGHGTEATMTMDQLLTDPEQAKEFDSFSGRLVEGLDPNTNYVGWGLPQASQDVPSSPKAALASTGFELDGGTAVFALVLGALGLALVIRRRASSAAESPQRG